jgi:peptidoglycan/LPS O-acetylase OafA/YrhL
LNYRSEVDGLRAVAVISVVFFHACIQFFSGGYIGVDVFFVISGYLITSLIIKDLEEKKFKLIEFYERRARRIFPALFLVMFICLPFSWSWMPLDTLKEFSQSLVAVSLFISNIIFWRQKSDYFNPATDEKPLLHTWSLAIEEQYYFIFPIFLLLTWGFGKNRVFWLIFIFATLSLILSEWGWRYYGRANFFLVPTRAWELLIGSLVAFVIHKYGLKKSNTFSMIGMCAICFSLLTFDKSTPFPSFYALIPVLGTAIILFCANKETFVGRLLGSKLCVGIGLISYSVYLWHQPLFSFAQINIGQKPSEPIIFSLIIASFVLGYLSWRLIEKPFRNRELINRKIIIFSSLLGITFFSSVGIYGHFSTQTKISKVLENIEPYSRGGNEHKWIDLVEDPEFLLIGDSHAKQYISALRDTKKKVSLISESACISLPNLINKYKFKQPTRNDCLNLHNKYMNYIDENTSIKTIIIAHSWDKELFDLKKNKAIGRADKPGETRLLYLNELQELIIKLTQKQKKIIVLGSVPGDLSVPSNMKKGYIKCLYSSKEDNCQKSYSYSERSNQWINKLLSDLVKNYSNVSYVDPSQWLCDGQNCWIVNQRRLFYVDHSHLSNFSAHQVITGIDEIGLFD